jgi:tetratricopeptide (TPR) repeat protein
MMNKFALFFALIFCIALSSVHAQDATTTGGPDANYGILQGKLKRSNAAIENEKKSTNPKTWLSRAEVMLDVFDLYRKFISKGMQEINIKLVLGEPKETQSVVKDGVNYEVRTYEHVKVTFKDGVVDSWEQIDKIYDDPLPEAQRSLDKARELDTDKKLTKKLKEDYDLLKMDYERQGIEEFMVDDYKGALKSFASIIDIDQLDLMGGVVDTVIMYNAGLAAVKVGDTDAAIKYFNMAKENHHKDPNLYVFLKNLYFETGDTAMGVKMLEEGFKRFSNDEEVKNLLIELINYYLLANETEEALEYLKVAKEEDPSNISFYFAEGTLYDKMGETEKAKQAYETCVQMDPDYFNAYYNMGVMYYNKAVEMYKEANTEPDINKYNVMKDEADKVLAKAVEPMEKAHEIAPDDCDTIDTLKTLYYRLQMTEKHEAIKELAETKCPKAADAPGE